MSKRRGLKEQLLRGGIGSIAVKMGNMLLGVGLAVVLARTLGAEEYGVYAYVFAIVNVLVIPGAFGLPQLIIRETASARAHEQWDVMRGLWRWSTFFSLQLSVVIALVAVVIAFVFADSFSSQQRLTFYWGVALLPLFTLGRLRGAALQGLRKVVQGQLPDQIIRQGLLILLIGGAVLLNMGLTAHDAMALHVVAATVGFGAGAWMLWKSVPPGFKESTVFVAHSKKWLASVLPMALSGGMQIINQHSGIIMLGWFSPIEDVGVYRVVNQGGILVAFGFQAINMVLAPYISEMYVKKERERLQKLLTNSTRFILLVTVPIVLVFVLYGKLVLGMVFGEEYIRGSTALAIVSVGQLINAGFGVVAVLLNMTGHEKETARGLAFGALLNIVLNLILIPLFGIEGAAVSAAVTFFTWNFLLWWAVTRSVGLDTLAIPVAGRLGKKKNKGSDKG